MIENPDEILVCPEEDDHLEKEDQQGQERKKTSSGVMCTDAELSALLAGLGGRLHPHDHRAGSQPPSFAVAAVEKPLKKRGSLPSTLLASAGRGIAAALSRPRAGSIVAGMNRYSHTYILGTQSSFSHYRLAKHIRWRISAREVSCLSRVH